MKIPNPFRRRRPAPADEPSCRCDQFPVRHNPAWHRATPTPRSTS